MDFPLAIGIDVGTTYCCVAVHRHSDAKPEVVPNNLGKNTTPSFVAYDEDGNTGQTAKDLQFQNPDSTISDFKRLIGKSFFDRYIQKYKNLWPIDIVNIEGFVGIKARDRTLYPQRIAKELIAQLVDFSKDYLGCPIKSAAVTIPAYFNELQAGLTRQACHEAGLENVRFITEPMAAAYAYGLQTSIQCDETKTCLIFDLGGGTLDVTVLELGPQKRLKILAIGGDARLGGEDFNDLLTQYCIDDFKRTHSIDLAAGKDSKDAEVRLKTAKTLRRIRAECEKQKIHLSSTTKVIISADCVHGTIDLAITVTREVFEDLIDNHLQRCIDEMTKTLKKSKIGKEAIDIVVLIGGSSRIPKVQQMVSEFFGRKELHKNINADEAVACGAAIFAYNVFGGTDNVINVKDTAHHIENPSNDAFKISQFTFTAKTYTNSTDTIDHSQEVLFKDLQAVKEIIMKHKQNFLNKSKDIYSWIQNFEILENDIKNKRATPSGRELVISAMLDAPLLPELANILWERYEDNDALKLNETILQRRESCFGKDHLETIEAQFQVARCLDELNLKNSTIDASNALDLYRIIHEKRKQILGEEHKDTLIVEYHIAKVLKDHKNYHDALNLAEKVYEMQRSILGSEQIETLRTHVFLGDCWLKQPERKHQDQAKKLGLPLFHKLKNFASESKNSRIVLATKASLALFLTKQQKFSEALSLYEDQNRVSNYGENNHLKSLETQYCIATCWNGLKEYGKALKIFEWVLDKRKQNLDLGPNHRLTLQVENSIASTLFRQGKITEALHWFQEVHVKCVKHLDPSDPLINITKNNLDGLKKK